MYDALHDEAKKVGSKNVGERTSWLWKLSEKKGDGQSTSATTRTGTSKRKKKVQERMDLREVWTASPPEALHTSVGKGPKEVQRAVRHAAPLEEPGTSPPDMQEDAMVW